MLFFCSSTYMTSGYREPRTTNASATNTAAGANDLIVQRIRWLADTPLYRDAFEIVAEKARRFWWGQQIDLASIPWSTLLAFEGRRRRIPNLFAFQCLAHLVSLSYAQNLFFVALLLTPTPLPEGVQSSSRFVGTNTPGPIMGLTIM